MPQRSKPKWPPQREFVALLTAHGSRDCETSFETRAEAKEWARETREFGLRSTIREYRLVPRKSRKGKPVRLSAKSRNENKPAKRRGKRG